MLAKLTSKNQITIPKKIIDQIKDAKYFDIVLKEGAVILKPVQVYESNLEQIRLKMKALNIKPDTVAEAVIWARKK